MLGLDPPTTFPAILRHRALIALALWTGVHALAPATASAGGFEYGVPGARSLGRAGADVAGIDTGLALYYNPSNLARMDRVRATVDVNLGIYDICMRREIVGNLDEYEPEEEVDLVENVDGRNFLPDVCNSGRPSIVPNIGVAIPIVDRLTLGVGLLIPVSSQVGEYGSRVGTRVVDGMEQPTPTRYMITKQDLLQFFGVIGLAYAPIPELRLGMTFGWGYTHARFTNLAYTPELGIGDVPSNLDAKDTFLPRVTVSASTSPIPGLDIAASFTWVGDINASGNVTLNALGITLPTDVPGEPPIDAKLNAGQPWNFSLGVRFADRLATPVGTVGDRLSTERWDVELALGIHGSSRVEDFVIDLPDGRTVATIDLPPELRIRHNWKNQYTVRVGGDYNPIPNVLGLRAGLSYESNGVSYGFHNVDFVPFQRVGIHLGGTVRIADRFDISIAYAHLFQGDSNLNAEYCEADVTNCLVRTAPGEAPPPEELVAVNAGVIRSSGNLLSLQLDYAF